MPAYMIYEGVVTDPERYEQYKARAAPSIAAAGGRYVVRGGETVALEGGDPPARVVVLEFPTMQALLDWFHGAEYTEAKKLREGAAQARLYAVEGA